MSIFIDPELRPVLAAMAPPPIDPGARSLTETALSLRAWAHAQPTPSVEFDGTIDQIEVPTRWGSLPARVYRPSDGADGGATVWFHGGGMILGNLDKAHFIASELATLSRSPVVAATYRLAPEHPFPAGPNDAYDVIAWLAEQGREIGLRLDRLAIGGESAGATMATAAALQAVRAGGPALCFQLLAYPKVDFVERHPSHTELAAVGIPDEIADVFDNSYLPPGTDRSDPLASPLRADLTGMPDGIVLVPSADTLRDEGECYGERLAEAGARVLTLRAAGQVHGFLDFTASSTAARRLAHAAYRAVGDALRGTR